MYGCAHTSQSLTPGLLGKHTDLLCRGSSVEVGKALGTEMQTLARGYQEASKGQGEGRATTITAANLLDRVC